MTAPERRAFACDQLELRADPANPAALPTLTGYAAVFNSNSRPIPGAGGRRFVERIRPGAFTRALAERQDVRALVNHDATLVLGRTKNGTLKLAEDARGLRVELQPVDTGYARDMVAQVRRRDVDAMSFGFRTVRDSWSMGTGPEGADVRTLEDVDLFDVSPTSFPAYEDTAVAVRSWAAASGVPAGEPDPDAQAHLAAMGPGRGFRLYEPQELERARQQLELEGPPMPAWTREEERAWADRNPGDTRACFHHHLGLYLHEPVALEALVKLAAAGQLPPVERAAGVGMGGRQDGPPPKPWTLEAGGVAVLRLEGSMAKDSKYGDTSTVAMRRHLRAAAADPEVRAVLLLVDSPGGQAAGTAELGDEVRRLGAQKPVHAYVEDLGASAAYWVAAQAQRVSCNATAQVGSVGVVSLLYDESQRYAREGLKVHVVATGPGKAALREGQPVLPEHVAQVQERVDFLFGHFRAAVQGPRRLTEDQWAAVADGRTFAAPRALELGLVDAVGTYEGALQELLRVALLPPAAPATGTTAVPPPAPAGPGLEAYVAQQGLVERGL